MKSFLEYINRYKNNLLYENIDESKYMVYTGDVYDSDYSEEFGNLNNAIRAAKRVGGYIRNISENPSDGGKKRYYNPDKRWSVTGIAWDDLNESYKLNEAKQTFRQYVKELQDTISKIKGFKSKDKIKFTMVDKETAEFSYEYNYDLSRFGNMKNRNESEVKKFIKTLGMIINNKNEPTFKINTIGGLVGELEASKQQNGYMISIEYHLRYEWKNYMTITFIVIGDKVKESPKVFTQYPEYTVGKVLYTTFGYDMTIPVFMQIVKRSGNRIYMRELQQNRSGDGFTGYAIPIIGDFEDNEIEVTTLPNPKWEKRYSLRLWDNNKKVRYNTLD